MLTFHKTPELGAVAVASDAPSLPADVSWVDAQAPTPGEIGFLRRVLGVEPPTLAQMLEIESSSRLYRSHAALFATLPIARRAPSGASSTIPLGFVITPSALLSLHFEPVTACTAEKVTATNSGERGIAGPYGALVAIVETIVDHIADELEGLTGELEKQSQTIFSEPTTARRRQNQGKALRVSIVRLGQARAYASHISETLLGLTRMTPFIAGEAERLATDVRARFERIDRDVASLTTHESRLSERIQFLLDASLGLIGVEQNDVFKILTMVSVVGIPPTLLASMYGMNFKNMPEYDWPWGYQYGLTVIFLSGLLPLLWFKWRRWW